MSTYYRKVDGLRFVAILMVFIEHFAHFIGSKFSAGYFGVDLFFVISGFLITSILLRSSKKPFWHAYKSFLGRRTLRIFPIYYLTIFVLFLLQVDSVKQYLGYLVSYTYNYASVYFDIPFNPVTHFWSLCVEEQFYLFWPFVVLVLAKRPAHLIWLIVLIMIFAFSQMSFNIIPALTPYNYQGLFTRMGSLAMGAFGSVLVSTGRLPKTILSGKVTEVVFLGLLIISLVFNHPLKYPVLSVCSLFLVLKSSVAEFNLDILNRVLSNKRIVFLGTISYGLYVYHVPIAHFAENYILNDFWNSINWDSLGILKDLRWHSWIFKFVVLTLMSIGVAFFSFRFIEMPILKLKDRYFKY